MNTTIEPWQTISTEQLFDIGNVSTYQTSDEISFWGIVYMTKLTVIRHPLTNERIDIDPSQEWFWTEEWQLGEKRVDKELAEGKYNDFNSVDELFSSL